MASRTEQRARAATTVAKVVGVILVVPGIWAMAAPESFFDTLADFPPYNQHLIQDIGAFQIGLGAVLLLAAFMVRADALAVGLLGVGIGAAAHAISHVVGVDLGGRPGTDIPFFAIVAGALLAAGIARARS